MENFSNPLVFVGVAFLVILWLGPLALLSWNRLRFPAGTRVGDDARSGRSWVFAIGWTLAPPVFYLLRPFL